MTAAPGATSDAVYVWVYQAGVTEGAGQGTGVTVDVGVGDDGTNPATSGTWGWTAASWFDDKDGLTPGDLANDEYTGTFTAPSATGSHDYAARASADGGISWTYCDFGGATECLGNGSDDGYSSTMAGDLTVE